MLTTSKVQYYKEESKKKLRGCINLGIASCKVAVTIQYNLRKKTHRIEDIIMLVIYIVWFVCVLRIQDIKGNVFTLEIEGYKRKFELKS